MGNDSGTIASVERVINTQVEDESRVETRLFVRGETIVLKVSGGDYYDTAQSLADTIENKIGMNVEWEPYEDKVHILIASD